MSKHAIPNDIDLTLLYRALVSKLRAPAGIVFSNGTQERPTELEFTPDLEAGELAALEVILEYTASAARFEALPDWATWTAEEAAQHITGAIFAGKTLAQVDADIDLLPATVAGMRTGLHQAAAALIAVRVILTALARAVIYLRNLAIKAR